MGSGEEALRAGRVGLLLVAGGQGTRLGFDGPKGAYPVGPLSKRSLFAFHAEKIMNLQRRYGCTLPWYIMVSDANEQATREFFREHNFFGLRNRDVTFFTQRMVPCMDDNGKFMLEERHSLAMNPNGHGGTIPAIIEKGIARDAHERDARAIISKLMADETLAQAGDARPTFLSALLAFRAKDQEAAQRDVQAALALSPTYGTALQLRKALGEAVAVDPTDPMPPEEPGSESYDSLVERGNKKAESSQCSEAIDVFKRALAARPNGVEALAGLGYCHLDMGHYSVARGDFRAALGISPRYQTALYGIAESYQKEGNAAEAIAAYRHFIEEHPNSQQADAARRQIERLGGGSEAPPPAATADAGP